MSQLNNNFSLPEQSGLSKTEGNEDTNYPDRPACNKELNDQYILNLLNNSNDSDIGKDANVLAESALNSSDKDKSISVSNESETLSESNSVQNESENQVNKLEENSDSGIKCGQIDSDAALKEVKELSEPQVKHGNEYRGTDDSSSWTEDEDSSSSSDSDFQFEPMQQSSSPKVNCVKTKGELDIEDLPPIEYLKISVEEEDLKKVGQVHAVVSKLVVIQATKDEKPLDIDSVLFLAPNEPLGRIFEVFGPVVEPFYTVLFNTSEDITEKGVKIGSAVFFAPLKNEITSYVFVDVLRQQKGSDASWKDNNEPPEEHLDYSDDEQERAARLKRKGKGRVRESEDDDEVQAIPYKISQNEKRTFNYTSYTQNNRFNSEKIRNSAQNNRSSVQSNRITIQNNRNLAHNSRSNLDNVPVWISTPPPYMESQRPPSQTNISNSPPVQSFQLKQPASLPVQNQVQPSNASNKNASQTQFRPGSLMLNPKQPFIPRQPPNRNSQRLLFHSQSPPPVGNTCYFPPPQRPFHQMQQNASQPIMFQNMNQHIFGQITPVGVMSPVPPMSPAPTMSHAIFSPCPSPTLYVQQNAFPSLPSPALSPNPYWHPQNQHSPSFPNVMSPPPTTPLTIQIPTFSSPPPMARFSAANNHAIHPPNFSTPLQYQYSSRF